MGMKQEVSAELEDRSKIESQNKRINALQKPQGNSISVKASIHVYVIQFHIYVMTAAPGCLHTRRVLLPVLLLLFVFCYRFTPEKSSIGMLLYTRAMTHSNIALSLFPKQKPRKRDMHQ